MRTDHLELGLRNWWALGTDYIISKKGYVDWRPFIGASCLFICVMHVLMLSHPASGGMIPGVSGILTVLGFVWLTLSFIIKVLMARGKPVPWKLCCASLFTWVAYFFPLMITYDLPANPPEWRGLYVFTAMGIYILWLFIDIVETIDTWPEEDF